VVQFRLDTDTKTFDAVSFDTAPLVTRSVLEQYVSYLDRTSEVNTWQLEFSGTGTAYIWLHVWDEQECKVLAGEETIEPDSSGNYRLDLRSFGLELMQEQ